MSSSGNFQTFKYLFQQAEPLSKLNEVVYLGRIRAIHETLSGYIEKIRLKTRDALMAAKVK